MGAIAGVHAHRDEAVLRKLRAAPAASVGSDRALPTGPSRRSVAELPVAAGRNAAAPAISTASPAMARLWRAKRTNRAVNPSPQAATMGEVSQKRNPSDRVERALGIGIAPRCDAVPHARWGRGPRSFKEAGRDRGTELPRGQRSAMLQKMARATRLLVADSARVRLILNLSKSGFSSHKYGR
jgi:hypothetical protein